MEMEIYLYYFAAGYYNNETGGWLSIDPLVDKYLGWSPYSFCLNNPLKMIGPDGKQPWPLIKSFKGLERRPSNNYLEPRTGGRLHQGADLNYGRVCHGDRGGPIMATHDGRVTKVAGPDEKNAGGARIEITSFDGTAVTRYMHLDSGPNLKENTVIKEGDIIGELGGRIWNIKCICSPFAL